MQPITARHSILDHGVAHAATMLVVVLVTAAAVGTLVTVGVPDRVACAVDRSVAQVNGATTDDCDAVPTAIAQLPATSVAEPRSGRRAQGSGRSAAQSTPSTADGDPQLLVPIRNEDFPCALDLTAGGTNYRLFCTNRSAVQVYCPAASPGDLIAAEPCTPEADDPAATIKDSRTLNACYELSNKWTGLCTTSAGDVYNCPWARDGYGLGGPRPGKVNTCPGRTFRGALLECQKEDDYGVAECTIADTSKQKPARLYCTKVTPRSDPTNCSTIKFSDAAYAALRARASTAPDDAASTDAP